MTTKNRKALKIASLVVPIALFLIIQLVTALFWAGATDEEIKANLKHSDTRDDQLEKDLNVHVQHANETFKQVRKDQDDLKKEMRYSFDKLDGKLDRVIEQTRR